MSKLKMIYEALYESGDLPEYFTGDWNTDKKQFELEYSTNNMIYASDEFDELD